MTRHNNFRQYFECVLEVFDTSSYYNDFSNEKTSDHGKLIHYEIDFRVMVQFIGYLMKTMPTSFRILKKNSA